MQVTLTIPDELAAYQCLLDLASEADEREGQRQVLEDVTAGRTYPAEEVFAAMREKYAIPH